MQGPSYSYIRPLLIRQIKELAEIRKIVSSPINFGGNDRINENSTDLAELGPNAGFCLRVQHQLLCRVSAKSEN